MTRLQAEAVVVHLFVAANGVDPEADRTYLSEVWHACGEGGLGLTEELPGTNVGLAFDLDMPGPNTRLLAARMRPRPEDRPTPFVEEALLRRHRDAFCLTVMREPDPAEGRGWAELDREWSEAVGALTPSGLIGEARLYLARLVEPGTPAPDEELRTALRTRYPCLDPSPGDWGRNAVLVPDGFVVWESTAPDDERTLRRIVVVAAENQDAGLSAWTWVGGGRGLPAFGRYLLHAARMRYQLRVWRAEEQGHRDARRATDTAVTELLGAVAPPGRRLPEPTEARHAQLLQASRELASLQVGAVGLVQASTRLREMSATVRIAAANLETMSGGNGLGGLFADDRELGRWFSQQLEDDAGYVEATRERAAHVAALTDQLVQRSLQQSQENLQRRRERLQARQERFNLALTGLIGAIVMVLTAAQSLGYTVPLPPRVKPAVIAALGAVALLASFVVLRVAAPKHAWTSWLVRAGVGVTGATITWVAVSAVDGGAAVTRWLALAGFVVSVAVETATARLGRRRPRPQAGSDQAPV